MRDDAIRPIRKEGDSIISADERKSSNDAFKTHLLQIMKAREKQFDKNGDGKLNNEERKALIGTQSSSTDRMKRETMANNGDTPNTHLSSAQGAGGR